MSETYQSPTRKGKVMAIDLGEKRIGLAVSDALRMVASGYDVIERRSRKEDFARYNDIIRRENITLVVMGLPIPLSGVEGDQAAWVRDYTTELRENIPVPVVFWDESLTTQDAEESLRARGKRNKQIEERIDAVAAAFILQDYLDAHYD